MWPFKKKSKRKKRFVRSYAAAATGRLYSDWSSSGNSADAEIQPSLETLRNRARDLARNNDYVKRFLNLSKTNIVGHKGVSLQVRSKNTDGKMDKYANNIIEAAWIEFCKKNNCSVTGQLSMIDIEKIIVESVMRDGEILVRKIEPWTNNSHLFALQLIEADQLDINYTVNLSGGRKIVMGVEKDKWGRPVAYHLLKNHPGDTLNSTYHRVERERVSADEIIHLFIPERVNQTRGVTWLASPAARIKMLDGYEEAELVASRTAASKMGFFISPDGDSFESDDEEDSGALISEAEPGTFEQLPEGMDFKAWNPEHPNSAFEDFEKAILRGVASGLNISYVALANNLEGVSYSSIRSGELADRDQWKVLQTWLVEHFCNEVYADWLRMFLTSGVSNLPLMKFDKFNQPVWRPRGWQWVDPDKESKSAARDIGNNIKSMWSVAAEKGDDLEEIFEANARAIKLAKEYGIELHVFNGDKKNEEPKTNQTED
jgi:lambda family phage portal protein